MRSKSEQRIDPKIEIKVWMLRNHITVSQIAQASRKTSGAVTRFLNRDFNSIPIAEAFRQRGCPGQYLDGNGIKAA